MLDEMRSDFGDTDRRLATAFAARVGAAAAAMGHLRLGIGLMDWRLKRTNGLEPAWAQFDEFNRHWSWTTDESEAFSAHNRYIVEALQRRAPDYIRYNTEVELKPNGLAAETRKRPASRWEEKC